MSPRRSENNSDWGVNERTAMVDNFFDRIGPVDSRVVKPFCGAIREYWRKFDRSGATEKEQESADLIEAFDSAHDDNDFKVVITNFLLDHTEINLDRLSKLFSYQPKDNVVFDKKYAKELKHREAKRTEAIAQFINRPDIFLMFEWHTFYDTLLQFEQKYGIKEKAALEKLGQTLVKIDKMAESLSKSTEDKLEGYRIVIRDFLEEADDIDIAALAKFFDTASTVHNDDAVEIPNVPPVQRVVAKEKSDPLPPREDAFKTEQPASVTSPAAEAEDDADIIKEVHDQPTSIGHEVVTEKNSVNTFEVDDETSAAAQVVATSEPAPSASESALVTEPAAIESSVLQQTEKTSRLRTKSIRLAKPLKGGRRRSEGAAVTEKIPAPPGDAFETADKTSVATPTAGESTPPALEPAAVVTEKERVLAAGSTIDTREADREAEVDAFMALPKMEKADAWFSIYQQMVWFKKLRETPGAINDVVFQKLNKELQAIDLAQPLANDLPDSERALLNAEKARTYKKVIRQFLIDQPAFDLQQFAHYMDHSGLAEPAHAQAAPAEARAAEVVQTVNHRPLQPAEAAQEVVEVGDKDIAEEPPTAAQEAAAPVEPVTEPIPTPPADAFTEVADEAYQPNEPTPSEVINSDPAVSVAASEQPPAAEQPTRERSAEMSKLEIHFKKLSAQAQERIKVFKERLGRYPDAAQLKEIAERNEDQLLLLGNKMLAELRQPNAQQNTDVYNKALQKMIVRIESSLYSHTEAEVRRRLPELQRQWAKLEKRYGERLAAISPDQFPLAAKLAHLSSNQVLVQRYFEQQRSDIEKAFKKSSSASSDLERDLAVAERLYQETEALQQEIKELSESDSLPATVNEVVQPVRSEFAQNLDDQLEWVQQWVNEERYPIIRAGKIVPAGLMIAGNRVMRLGGYLLSKIPGVRKRFKL